MRNGVVIDPILSCEMVNPAVKKMSDLFDKGFEVLYIYGPPGTGKSLAIELLVDEHEYAVHKLDKKIETKQQVTGLSRGSSLLDSRKTLVLVDSIDTHSKQELALLAQGDWKYNKLILVGEKYPRASNPISPFAKNKNYGFKKIKFDKISELHLAMFVLDLATKHKMPMLKADRDKIVNASDGDIRKCLSVTKNYLLGGGVDLEGYLPQNEETQFNRVKRMLGGNYEDALEEIENFGWYYSIIIMAANLEDKSDKDELLEMLMDLSKSKLNDRERLLALVACKIHKKYTKGKYTKWIFPKRATKQEISTVIAKCSNMKKEMYFI